MFKRSKGKPTLQELEHEYNVRQMQLGGLVVQAERIAKEKAVIIQKMESLSKQGIELKKKIGAEIENKIAEGETKEGFKDELN